MEPTNRPLLGFETAYIFGVQQSSPMLNRRTMIAIKVFRLSMHRHTHKNHEQPELFPLHMHQSSLQQETEVNDHIFQIDLTYDRQHPCVHPHTSPYPKCLA